VQGIAFRRQTNEVILLVVAKPEGSQNNVKSRVFLASVNFDKVEEGSYDLAKIVRV